MLPQGLSERYTVQSDALENLPVEASISAQGPCCVKTRMPISFCYGEGNIISCGMAMCGMDLAQSETPCAWRRPLCGTWEASWRPQPRPAVSGQSGKLEGAKPGGKA